MGICVSLADLLDTVMTVGFVVMVFGVILKNDVEA
jgi:hypothetical protein